MKLHLGCGKRDFGSEWVHIDQCEFPHVTHKDVTKLPFDDGSCDLIYASHLLEYFDREEAAHVLKEWYRVLGKDGILRLAVPDFEAMCNLYITPGYFLDRFLGPLYGKMGDPPIYHKTVYDFRSLKSLLQEVGFKEVVNYNWSDTDHSNFDDHSQAYIPHMDKDKGTLISLNVEASK
jgi:predicted SAM-dependent methyltransferase